MPRPQIIDTKEIPLDSLVVGKAQVRLSDPGKGVDELAASIEQVGLLEPIMVCQAETPGRFEIILGQRRVLAHQRLKLPTIRATIIDQKLDELDAKVLSLTENLLRRDVNKRDLIDVCTELFRRYGSAAEVARATGLPYQAVNQYVKYDRLKPELRQLVDSGMDLKAALRAQDAAESGGSYDPSEAVKLAKEMAAMSGAQRNRIVEERQENPNKPVDDVIEDAKSGSKVVQMLVTLGATVHQSLQTYAKEEGVNQDEAAADLITETLTSKGFLGE